MTLVGSCGVRPTRLDGADSTAGAPDGGEGMTASAVADAPRPAPVRPRPAAAAMAASRLTFRERAFESMSRCLPDSSLLTAVCRFRGVALKSSLTYAVE